MTCTDLQQPGSKGITLWSPVQLRVLFQIKNLDVIPQSRTLYGCIDDGLSGTFGNNRGCLTKITTKQHSNAPKEPGIIPDVLQSPIQGLNTMAMLHWSFIIDNDICLPNDLCKFAMLLDPAS